MKTKSKHCDKQKDLENHLSESLIILQLYKKSTSTIVKVEGSMFESRINGITTSQRKQLYKKLAYVEGNIGQLIYTIIEH